MTAASPGARAARIDRAAPGCAPRPTRAFFAAKAERIAAAVTGWPSASSRGGRLVALGHSAAARSDVRHVAVEFVHPVIVGKRALPALGLAAEGGPLTRPGRRGRRGRRHRDRLRRRGGRRGRDGRGAGRGARPGRDDDRLRRGGRRVGVQPPRPTTRSCARSWSRRSTTCSGSWSTCSSTTAGCSQGASARTGHDAGASSFLYPFLAESETDLDAVTEDVRGSALMKSAEVGELREQTLGENARGAGRGGDRPARRLDAGGRLLACGNGGSATDAMDLVADSAAHSVRVRGVGCRRTWPAAGRST